MPRRKKQSIQKLAEKYMELSEILIDELLELKKNKFSDKKDIKMASETLNGCVRTFLFLAGEEGKTKMSQAKIKKIDSSAEEVPIEKLWRDLK